MDALAYALMPLLEVDSIPDTLNKTKNLQQKKVNASFCRIRAKTIESKKRAYGVDQAFSFQVVEEVEMKNYRTDGDVMKVRMEEDG